MGKGSRAVSFRGVDAGHQPAANPTNWFVPLRLIRTRMFLLAELAAAASASAASLGALTGRWLMDTMTSPGSISRAAGLSGATSATTTPGTSRGMSSSCPGFVGEQREPKAERAVLVCRGFLRRLFASRGFDALRHEADHGMELELLAVPPHRQRSFLADGGGRDGERQIARLRDFLAREGKHDIPLPDPGLGRGTVGGDGRDQRALSLFAAENSWQFPASAPEIWTPSQPRSTVPCAFN